MLLTKERRGVLAVNGEEGYPYAVPINFLYSEADNCIYFHGARAGYKIEMIRQCDKVCFTVYGNETIRDLAWAPYVQSVVIFGRCTLIGDQSEAIRLVRNLAAKYYPGEAEIEEEVSKSGNAVQMFKIEIEHMSGKEIHEI